MIHVKKQKTNSINKMTDLKFFPPAYESIVHKILYTLLAYISIHGYMYYTIHAYVCIFICVMHLYYCSHTKKN